MKEAFNEEVIIKSNNKRFLPDFNALFEYKDLLYFMIFRGIKAKYAQSILGIGWAIIQPLIQTVIFTVIFGNLAQLSSDGIPYVLFSFIALIAWNYFQNSVTESSNSLVANKNILSKVYFPRMIIPLSILFSKFIDFFVCLIVLFFLLLYYDISFETSILFFPLLVLILFFTSCGVSLILSSLAVQYRDVSYGASFFIRLLLYCAPVVYSLSVVPKDYLFLYSLNPLVGVIEGMRACFFPSISFPWDLIITGSCTSFFILFIGLIVFTKVEKSFADVA